MGQKVHPLVFRLVTTQKHRSVWFSEFGNYPKLLEEDAAIRKFFDTKSQAGGISKIDTHLAIAGPQIGDRYLPIEITNTEKAI